MQPYSKRMKKKTVNEIIEALLVFFCSYLFAPSPRSESLEHANMGESVSRGSRGVLVSPPPPHPALVRKIPFLSFVQKRRRKLINQTPTFSLKFPFQHSLCWKFFRIQVKVFSSSGSCMNQNFFFNGLHNLSFLVQPFCRLVLPHAHCSFKRKDFLC